MTIRFPIDLTTKQNGTFPFVQFQIAKFRERTLLKDFYGQSSKRADDAAFRKLAALQTDLSITEDQRKLLEDGATTASSTTTIVEDIFLPLPQNLQNVYSPDWEMSDMILVNSAIDALNAETTNAGIRTLENGIMAATLARSGGKFAEKFAAKTPNPKKQALFNGIEPRTFSFDYTFSPQSEQEASIVENIIRSFTKYSLPSLKTPTSAFFDFPYEYRIFFHKTKGFPIVNWCVCTSATTNYGPNTMQLLKSGHVSQIQLTLTFMETDLRTMETPGV